MTNIDETKIVLVEDHQIARLGLKLLLEEIPGFRVIGQAETGNQAVDKTLELKPDVVIMDIGLSGGNGIEATLKIKNTLPQVRVIMLTSHDDDQDIFAALRVGADGYCLKDIRATDLAHGIWSVKQGFAWLDPRIAKRVLGAPDRPTSPNNAANDLFELDFGLLYLVERGFDNDEIARELKMSKTQVREKMRSIIESIFLSDKSVETIKLFRRQLAAHITDDLSRQGASVEDTDTAISSLAVNEIFADKYVLEVLIDRGGMGRIYKAKHIHMDRPLAIKILLPNLAQNRKLLRKFRDEVVSASALNHPNLVTIYDTGTWRGLPFLVMDYIDGIGLDRVLRKEARLELDRFLDIFIQVFDAIGAAHKENLIHCDLKPSNMLLTKQHGKETVKIVDFGLARMICPPGTDAHLLPTESFELAGSPLYMSPEQCCGKEVDQRSDLYSLGCVMYESLTGFLPFKGDTAMEVLTKHITELPKRFAEICPDLPKYPPAIEDMVLQLLAKEPNQRIQSVIEVKNVLQQLRAQIA